MHMRIERTSLLRSVAGCLTAWVACSHRLEPLLHRLALILQRWRMHTNPGSGASACVCCCSNRWPGCCRLVGINEGPVLIALSVIRRRRQKPEESGKLFTLCERQCMRVRQSAVIIRAHPVSAPCTIDLCRPTVWASLCTPLLNSTRLRALGLRYKINQKINKQIRFSEVATNGRVFSPQACRDSAAESERCQ